MARVTIASLLALLSLTTAVAGQGTSPEPIATDRPDFTEASSLVATGQMQVETGWTLTRARGAAAPAQHSWPELLVRVGVSQRVELRLGQALASLDPGVGERFTAFEDLYVGAKIALSEQRGAMPQMAMLVQATVPTGDSRLTADEILPGGALLAGWDTGGPWSFAAGVQVNKSGVEGVEVAPSVAIGLGLSRVLNAYGEWFAFYPVNGDGLLVTQHYANGGVALLLTNDVQLDGRVGFGLNDAADKVFFGIGLSLRR